ncbi:MAG: membrane protein insertase YidC [Pseudomonadota bacterium]
MDDQNKNLILATLLSFLVIMTWTVLFPPEDLPLDPTTDAVVNAEDPTVPTADPAEAAATIPTEASDAVAEAPRVAIETGEFSGSLSLLGGRIDDLALTQYRETIEEGSPIVRLLRPVGERGAYFASFGWTATDGLDASMVPGPDTLWSLETGDSLTAETPITLVWDNGVGHIFRTVVSVDDEFMFTFEQSVENTTTTPISARPYGLLRRHGQPDDLKNFFILHEGLVRMTDGELEETGYGDITEYEIDPRERTQAERLDVQGSGWIGYTDHYWMTTLIPDQTAPFRSTSKYFDNRDLFQAEAVMPIETVAAGGTATVNTRLFAGAKEWEAIRNYQNDAGVAGFTLLSL